MQVAKDLGRSNFPRFSSNGMVTGPARSCPAYTELLHCSFPAAPFPVFNHTVVIWGPGRLPGRVDSGGRKDGRMRMLLVSPSSEGSLQSPRERSCLLCVPGRRSTTPAQKAADLHPLGRHGEQTKLSTAEETRAPFLFS